MATYFCRNGHRFYDAQVQEPNYCPLCGVVVMALVVDTIRQWLRSNYPGFTGSVNANTQAYVLVCNECKTNIGVKSIDTLGVNVNTYISAILRRTLERHIVECDGTVKIKITPQQSTPYNPKRKIVVKQ
jgi:hypothetical protein